ncbi:centrosomal protein of 95 kDa isoform X2 [Hyla sarda]|uniref:centrosomal protein of 95 kDa isoform X2 n=1 Tax=Hyla sarda TaxID=327740 RepID=UPI0024C36F74|nr:centrosomal protein of 95 kDa isoform X2 [Hyla sarda]
MGAQETDWVTIANNLRSRCHVTLPLSDLTHCDARFFVSIYEAILGEKVPDFITDSQTPEDDAHNVQSVIDSLALDYLQVSLSHITGENVVRGDTESIRNLLEIFDGLLEYLTEQISEASSQNGDLECKDRRGSHDVPPSLKPPPSIGSLSSDLHPPSWVVEGSESTAELIRLGDTAHTFALRGLDVERTPQPMMQPRTPTDVAHEVCPVERPLKSAERKGPKEGSQEVHLGQKRVAFCTQPDIRLMTLQSSLRDWNDGAETSAQREDTEETLLTTLEPLSLVEEPLSVQRARNRLSELELQEMSEKLSRRLDELDRMLKAALGGPMRSSDQEDKLSQHSDSIMEIRRKKRLHATGRTRPPTARPRSLSSSPPPPRSLSAQFEDALNKEARGEMGKIRRNVQKELEVERLKAQLLRNAYAQELKDFEETERQKLVKLKEGLREEEQEYKENIFKEPPKKSHPEKVYAGKRAPSKPKHWAPNLHKSENRMKIKENDLLPLLLEEFPHLQISQQTLNAMWRGQMAQVEQLARSGQDTERSERHLQNEVEEARKKHNLLVSLIQKEQEHNQRLKDFKDRIRLQKSAQNRMRENRSQAARAKKYYDDYHVQLRAKLMRARTREEKIFKNLFEEGLEVQKERLREIRSYAKEQREEQRRRHRDELESMENYYKDQFAMLAEAVSQEKQEIHTREKSQAKTLHKIKRDLRGKMEKEIEALQQLILRTDEDAFFRELEAERLRRRVQMASFQYSKSHCL